MGKYAGGEREAGNGVSESEGKNTDLGSDELIGVETRHKCRHCD